MVPLATNEGSVLYLSGSSVLFSFDATAQQQLYGFSPDLHQNMSLRCYSLVVEPPWKSVLLYRKKLGLKTSIFGAKIHTLPSLDSRCTETRRNSGKTKTTGITTISRLPDVHVWWNLVWGHLSYRGLISCAFWPMALSYKAVKFSEVALSRFF